MSNLELLRYLLFAAAFGATGYGIYFLADAKTWRWGFLNLLVWWAIAGCLIGAAFLWT